MAALGLHLFIDWITVVLNEFCLTEEVCRNPNQSFMAVFYLEMIEPCHLSSNDAVYNSIHSLRYMESRVLVLIVRTHFTIFTEMSPNFV